MSAESTQLVKAEKPLTKAERLSLIPATDRGVSLTSMEDMYRFAATVVNSGLAPSSFKTPEAVIVAIQFGMEIGLTPMQALQNECVINGKVGVYGEASLAICMRDSAYEDHEEWYEVDKNRIAEEDVIPALKLNQNVVSVTLMKAKGRIPVRRAFSVEDAKKAQLWGKQGPWTNYPQRMLRFKARHWAEKDCFPNALKGIPLAEDLITEYGAQPKQIKAREVATGLVLPDEPEPVNQEPTQPTIEPSDNDGGEPQDWTKGPDLFP